MSFSGIVSGLCRLFVFICAYVIIAVTELSSRFHCCRYPIMILCSILLIPVFSSYLCLLFLYTRTGDEHSKSVRSDYTNIPAHGGSIKFGTTKQIGPFGEAGQSAYNSPRWLYSFVIDTTYFIFACMKILQCTAEDV